MSITKETLLQARARQALANYRRIVDTHPMGSHAIDLAWRLWKDASMACPFPSKKAATA